MNKKILVVVIGFVILGGAGLYVHYKFFGGRYSSNVFRLALNSTSHLMCTCLFVSELPESECRIYSAIQQADPKITVDFDRKLVESRLFGFFSGKARFLEQDNRGCTLVE